MGCISSICPQISSVQPIGFKSLITTTSNSLQNITINSKTIFSQTSKIDSKIKMILKDDSEISNLNVLGELFLSSSNKKLSIDGSLSGFTGSISTPNILITGPFSLSGISTIGNNFTLSSLSSISANFFSFYNSSFYFNGSLSASGELIVSTLLNSSGSFELSGSLNLKNQTVIEGVLNASGNLSIQSGSFLLNGNMFTSNIFSFEDPLSFPNQFFSNGAFNLNNGSLSLSNGLVNMMSTISPSNANSIKINIASFISIQSDLSIQGSILVDQNNLKTTGNLNMNGLITSSFLDLNKFSMNGISNISSSLVSLDGIFNSNLMRNNFENLFLNSSIILNGQFSSSNSLLNSIGTLELFGLLNLKNQTVIQGVLNASGNLLIQSGSFLLNGNMNTSDIFSFISVSLNEVLFKTNGSFSLINSVLSLSDRFEYLILLSFFL